MATNSAYGEGWWSSVDRKHRIGESGTHQMGMRQVSHDNRSSRKSCISCFSVLCGPGSSVGSGGASVRPESNQWQSKIAVKDSASPLCWVREGRVADLFVGCFAALVRNLDLRSGGSPKSEPGFHSAST